MTRVAPIVIALCMIAPCWAAKAKSQNTLRKIDAAVVGIDHDNHPPHRREATIETDGGCTFTYWGDKRHPSHIRLDIGLSNSVVRSDYYFKRGRLIFSSTKQWRFNPLIGQLAALMEKTPAESNKRYFKNGLLLSTKNRGGASASESHGREVLRDAAALKRAIASDDRKVDLTFLLGK